MTTRNSVALALTLAAMATLGTQTLMYGLVYPAGSWGTKKPLALALAGGAALAVFSAFVCWRALRRSQLPSERFVALLGLVLSGFFLFIVLFGFGIPNFFLSPKD
jgi:hypothetical protein